MELFLQICQLVLGFALLVKGADFFVDGAAGAASKFGIPQLVIGLTIVAMGTSAPETAVSLTAAFQGNAGITIGNVLGSNILNILVILGLTAVIVPLHVKESTAHFEMPYVVIVSALLAVLGLWDGVVGFADGVILWMGLLLFLGYLFRLARSGEAETEETGRSSKNLGLLLAMTAGGLAVIIWGSDLTVDSATAIAQALGVDERVIGLTIVALGTSLPELVTSVTAGLKGNADIAFGNIIGSNILNVLFVAGTTALITPVVYADSFLPDSLVLVGASLLLWLLAVKRRTLSRAGGIVMLLCYGGYLWYLL